MVQVRRVVDGEMFGAPVPGRWPFGRNSTERESGDQDDSDERPSLVRRLARRLRLAR